MPRVREIPIIPGVIWTLFLIFVAFCWNPSKRAEWWPAIAKSCYIAMVCYRWCVQLIGLTFCFLWISLSCRIRLTITHRFISSSQLLQCTRHLYGNVFCSKRPCWCTNVGMVWLRLTCRLTACQPHHTTVGVIYALLLPDNSLFHARRLTTVTAVSLLVVRPCGTVYQLHFDWRTCHCLSFIHGWKHFWWHKLQCL